MKLKSERWLGWGKEQILFEYKAVGIFNFSIGKDDIGAVNFEAVCASGARLVHRPMASWINDRGKWGPLMKCPEAAPAICGIKSRVDTADPNQGRYQVPDITTDQAGLTEVQLKCCAK